VHDQGDLDVVAPERGKSVEQFNDPAVGWSAHDAATDVGADGVDLGGRVAEVDHVAVHEVDTDALPFGDLEDGEGMGERRVGWA
jgi:hypothetical protein